MGSSLYYPPKPGMRLRSPAPRNHTSVHSSSLPTPCPTRFQTLFSHKSSALHSPFLIPSGNRGKPGSLPLSHAPHFQNPSIPQPRFRKLSHPATASHQSSSPLFPLFLLERRVLLSFLLISYTFSPSPSRSSGQPATLLISESLRAPSAGFLPGEKTECRRPQSLGIQRSTPVFHAHNTPKVNTIKKKKR